MQALVARATRIARRDFELGVHFGVAQTPGAVPFSRSYQSALAAAGTALNRGEKLAFFKSSSGTSSASLVSLRRELARVIEESPAELSAKFERYIEAVLAYSGQRLEPTQIHLEVGFERAAEPLLETGTLEARSFDVLRSALQRAIAGSRSVHALCAAYRTAVTDLAAAVQRPVVARRDRRLRTAIDYIGAHYTEPLSLASVAKVAGFAPGHFSKLFSRSQGISFDRYVRTLRLGRARHLLANTELEAARVARLSGYRSPQYFSRAFKQAFGVTPVEYRARPHDRNRL
jgi:AraC-like DNA-binding protein